MSTTTNESATLVLEGKNEFLGNSVTSSLFFVSGIIPVIKNYTKIENNTANIIFTFSKYIELHKLAEVNITGNKYNPTEKSFSRYIFEKISKLPIKECPFQVNQTSIHFCNNEGYYRNFFGDDLEYNCNWIKGYQKKSILAEYRYRNTMKSCDEGYFSWVNNLFLCNYAPYKPHLNSSIYPGQTVTLKLVHSQYSISLYTADPSTVFADIAPTCQLDSLKYTDGLVHTNCTSLHYTIKSNSTSTSMCLLKLRTATLKNVLYVFKSEFITVSYWIFFRYF